MIEVKAPGKYSELTKSRVSVFTAGSIEMDKAERWQERLVKALSDLEQVVVLNPRRENWDSSWTQDIENRQFREQVEWELDALESSDVIAMYFDKDTKSPITLLELGMNCLHEGLIVYCPDGYWKKGNVDVVCNRHGIRSVDSWDDFVMEVREAIMQSGESLLGKALLQ